MNILRESNSVLRDEKNRAIDEKEAAAKTIKELEQKIVSSRDDFKSKFDQKSAEYRAKDNELNEMKVQNHKLNQQVQLLETEKTSLSKQSEQSKVTNLIL